MSITKLVKGVLWLMLFSAPAWAETFYISSAGGSVSCGGDGTQTTSAASFFNDIANWGAGAGKISPDDTVNLCGTFTGTFGNNILKTGDGSGSGTSGHPVTIRWESNALLTSPGCGGTSSSCFDAFSSHDLVFDFNNTNPSITNIAEGTLLTNQTDSWAIRAQSCDRCLFKNGAITDLYVRTSKTDKLCAPILSNGCGAGFWISGVGWRITNMTFDGMFQTVFNNMNSGETWEYDHNTINHYNWGVFSGTGSNTTSGHFFHDNHFMDSDNWDDETGANAYHHDDLIFSNSASGLSGNIQVYDNLSNGNYGARKTADIFINQGITSAYIFDNVLINTNAKNGPYLIEVGFPGDTNFHILNNYLDCNGGGSGGGGGINGSSITNIDFQNNALANCSANVFLFMSNMTGTINWDHNVYANVSGTRFRFNSDVSQTFADYKAATGNDTNSLTPATLGADSSGHPLAGSAMIHTGPNFPNLFSLGITALDTDFGGVARPSGGSNNWDAGAYMFQMSPGFLTPIPTTLSFGSVQIGSNATLPVTVTNTGGIAVIISGISANAGFTTDFTPPVTLNPGVGTTINVTFTPTFAGTASGNVTLTHNGTNTPLGIPVSGTGTNSPPPPSDNTVGISGSVSITGHVVIQPTTQFADYYVDPVNGNDANPGTFVLPFKTIYQATTAVRTNNKHTVMLRATGKHRLTVPWTFGTTDSGTVGNPIIYEAFPGEKPEITGLRLIAPGQPGILTPWSIDSVIGCGGGNQCTLWFIDLDGDPTHANHFEKFIALFYNDVRRLRPRTTDDQSYLRNTGASCVGPAGARTGAGDKAANLTCGCALDTGVDVNGDGKPIPCAFFQTTGICSDPTPYQCLNRFLRAPGDILGTYHGTGIRDIEILNFHRWMQDRLILKTVNGPLETAIFTGPVSASDGNSTQPNGRYIVENVSLQEAWSIKKGGKWYLDRCIGCAPDVATPTTTWRLYYLAPAGEDPSVNMVEVPGLTAPANKNSTGGQIINQAVGSTVRYINFVGLTFSGDNWIANPLYGLGDQQDSPWIQAGISFNQGDHINFDGVTIRNMQGWGLEFKSLGQGSASQHDNSLTNSVIYDTGSGQLRIGDRPLAGNTDSNVTSYTTVTNNAFIGMQRLQATGIGHGVWIGQGHHNVVTHNECAFSYNGCFTLGTLLNHNPKPTEGPSYIHDNFMDYNYIHDIGRGVTSDMGAIYFSPSLSPNCPTQGTPTLSPYTYCNGARGNVAADVTHAWEDADGYGGELYYFDQGSTNVDLRYNLGYRASEACYVVSKSDKTPIPGDSYPMNILIANNVMVDCGSNKSVRYQVILRRGFNPLSFTFINNISEFNSPATPNTNTLGISKWSCYDTSNVLHVCTDFFTFGSNIWWNRATGHALTFVTCTSNTCAANNTYTTIPWGNQSEEDLNPSISADPLFTNESADNYIPTASQVGSINFLQGPGFFNPAFAGRTNPLLIVPPVPDTYPVFLLNRNTDY